MKKSVLVSRCLLGEPCRYDGRSKPDQRVTELEKGYRLVPVCPEVLGGLSTPRPPAEIQPDGRVVNREGTDVTREYEQGAQCALEIALQEGCHTAVLKENSPSCGCREIYDGSFSKRLIPGEGVAAKLLREHGIRVLGESEVDQLG